MSDLPFGSKLGFLHRIKALWHPLVSRCNCYAVQRDQLCQPMRNRFCDAMVSIRSEIAAIGKMAMDRENNPLKNAPHTVFDLIDENWTRPYARAVACFPAKNLLRDKYWCPVNRVDNVYGDRHLVCSCPPVESYQSAAE